MVCFFSSTKVLLALLTCWSFWWHYTQAFCIYNNMGDNIKFYIEAAESTRSSFKKELETNGSKECCNYGNSDCNPSGDKYQQLEFNVNFKFNPGTPDEYSTFVKGVFCTAGGALSFNGTRDHYQAFCAPPDGNSQEVIRLNMFREEGRQFISVHRSSTSRS